MHIYARCKHTRITVSVIGVSEGSGGEEGGAEDLDSHREAARERTRALAQEEGRCHIPHLHGSRSQQNVVLWI
jgi:hypothetical protein